MKHRHSGQANLWVASSSFCFSFKSGGVFLGFSFARLFIRGVVDVATVTTSAIARTPDAVSQTWTLGFASVFIFARREFTIAILQSIHLSRPIYTVQPLLRDRSLVMAGVGAEEKMVG